MLQTYLDLTNKLVRKLNWIRLDEFTVCSRLNLGQEKEIDLTILALVHGNEPLGLNIVIDLMTSILEGGFTPNLSLCFSLGNVPAYVVNQRYIDIDLNRTFGLKDIQGQELHSRNRVEKILNTTKYMLDLHQTQAPSSNEFFIAKKSDEHFHFCNAVAPKTPAVTYDSSISLSNESDGYVDSKGGIGITLELGQIGYDPMYLHRGINICINAISYVESECIFRKLPLTKKNHIYTIKEKLIQKRGTNLISGLTNFSHIKSNQALTFGEQVFFAEQDAYILFPKYEPVIINETHVELMTILTEHHWHARINKSIQTAELISL